MKIKILPLLPVFVIAIGIVLTQSDSARQLRSNTSANTDAAKFARGIEEEAVKASKKLAESRYESGLCLVAKNPIAPNQSVENLKEGSFVCDRWGTTAIVASNGELIQLASTNNVEHILEGLK